MSRTRIAYALTVCLLALSARSLMADARADQKAKLQFAGTFGKVVNFFGGKAARDGVTTSVAVKGDRKISTSSSTGQIVDLAEEKIYDLDLKKKTYKVTTFEEMRRRLQEAQEKAKEDAAKSQAGEQEPAQKEGNEVEVDFDVKQTGETKTINGFSARQAIMTITVREKGKTIDQSGGLIMTSDMWLAPRMDAMAELQAFDVKYFQKLYGPVLAGASEQDMATALALYPMLKPAMARMSQEAAKLEGTPVLTTTTMDSVKSAEQMAAEKQQTEAESSPSSQKGLGGLFGGLAKKAAKKDEAPKARATFMTITNEVLKVGTDVAATDVALPAGFKLAN
jgi:hypothetical protein